MSYSISGFVNHATTRRVIGLNFSSDTALSVGNPIPWAIYDGSASHGVTVNAGVITLPADYEYLVMAQAVGAGTANAVYKFYIDSSLSADSQYIETRGEQTPTQGNKTSNTNASAIVQKSSSSQTVELRATVASTIISDYSHLTILQIG